MCPCVYIYTEKVRAISKDKELFITLSSVGPGTSTTTCLRINFV